MKPIYRTGVTLVLSSILACGILVFLRHGVDPGLIIIFFIPLTITLFIFFKIFRYPFLALCLFVVSFLFSIRGPCLITPQLYDPDIAMLQQRFGITPPSDNFVIVSCFDLPIKISNVSNSNLTSAFVAWLLNFIFWFLISYLLVRFLPKLFKRKKEEFK